MSDVRGYFLGHLPALDSHLGTDATQVVEFTIVLYPTIGSEFSDNNHVAAVVEFNRPALAWRVTTYK